MVKKKVTESTNIQVYRTCVLSTLLHDSESWTLQTTNGEEAYYFPDALSPTHTQHYLARQSLKQHSPAAT